jgi:hypothetical protein
MRNLARKLESKAVWQDVGAVTSREGPTFVVRGQEGTYRASRAVSCLVEPEIGDRVLVSAVGDDEAYVLAVLRRDADEAPTIAVDGDLRVRLASGRFEIAAQEGVVLASGKDVSVVSDEVRVNARTGHVVVEQLAMIGARVRAEIDGLKIAAKTIDQVAERVLQRVKRAYRFVEEAEQVRAETLDYAADKSLSLRGENALVTAQELVKVDGSQIHVG